MRNIYMYFFSDMLLIHFENCVLSIYYALFEFFVSSDKKKKTKKKKQMDNKNISFIKTLLCIPQTLLLNYILGKLNIFTISNGHENELKLDIMASILQRCHNIQ